MDENKSIKNWAKDLSRYYSEDMQMTKRYMKNIENL
jgi:hypothetical protein